MLFARRTRSGTRRVTSKLGLLPLPTLCALAVAGCVTGAPSSAGAAVVPLPIEAAFSAPGPFATTTGTVMKGSKVEYDLFYPSDYASVGFKSPITGSDERNPGQPLLWPPQRAPGGCGRSFPRRPRCGQGGRHGPEFDHHPHHVLHPRREFGYHEP